LTLRSATETKNELQKREMIELIDDSWKVMF